MILTLVRRQTLVPAAAVYLFLEKFVEKFLPHVKPFVTEMRL